MRIAIIALAAVPLIAPSLAAQEDLAGILVERREGVPAGKRAFEETWLLPAAGGVVSSADETRFAGRVSVFQQGSKERIEIRPVEEGALGDPIVIVSDDGGYHLVTRVGATPFATSAPARDPFVQLVLTGPAGAAPPHRIVPGPGGGVAAVVLRSEGRAAFDPDEAFELRLPQVGGGLLRTGLSSFSAAQNTEVTASAGARGVDQVRTANGTVSVTPDPAAVEWMEARRVSPVEFETFKMEARLPPYDALPEEPAEEPATEPQAAGTAVGSSP
ncbi:MAG TPA: hypothetical protein VM737_06195 [Gemmatimonadota bacterium]|nr:hypothetical protein [Gemmatimonadota bacterium]